MVGGARQVGRHGSADRIERLATVHRHRVPTSFPIRAEADIRAVTRSESAFQRAARHKIVTQFRLQRHSVLARLPGPRYVAVCRKALRQGCTCASQDLPPSGGPRGKSARCSGGVQRCPKQ
ncbi:hypothetical protein [Lysobacter gummosus]|uniref:hypothetical protein n=1 Tax=Lysobacter gummosus TaxID=262324 RepID=UPI003635D053